MNKTVFTLSIAMILASSSSAVTLEEAKALYLKKKYTEALPAFQELYKKNAKNAKNASINQWIGVCLYETGQQAEAKQYFEYAASRSVLDANLYLSKIEFGQYNFEAAQEHIETYSEELSKLKKDMPNDVRDYMAKTRAAKSMIEHVERITVIDSLEVDQDGFFNHYRLSPSMGRFISPDQLPYEKPQNTQYVFSPENGEQMLWVDTDSAGITRLMETSRLIDGSWEHYTKADDMLNNDGNIAYPFMMPDGSTLYYSCDGNGSIGGYDIYMSRKNIEDGSYYQPQNLGMPYNSPFNDYLLVIDENTGVGWWATDRNQIPGKITIYMFIPNEVRENYDPSDEKISDYAFLNNIKDTWTEGADYSEYFERIETATSVQNVKKNDFEFEVMKGVVYTTYDDAATSEGKQYLEQYINTLKNYDATCAQLQDLRGQYAQASKSEQSKLKNKILNLENVLLKKQEELQYLKNTVVKAEQRKLNHK
ncbi:MAG: hypothetical protein ACI308_04630 [Muribaculaceae bacterium]